MCYIKREIPNGVVTVTNTHQGSTVRYACDNGYTLVGPATRECLITGTWSGHTPVCVSNTTSEST